MSAISLLSACRLLLDANRMGALMTNEQIMIRSRQAKHRCSPYYYCYQADAAPTHLPLRLSNSPQNLVFEGWDFVFQHYL